MKISSSAFADGGKIPALYTCEGKEVHPPLSFTDVPQEAVSLVLLMDDPDVPSFVRKEQMWDHWVIYNIPPTCNHIPQGGAVPGVQGVNTEGSLGYQGPCPPDREHRYFFKLYALDTLLKLPPKATKSMVEEAMQGHILSQATLMGRYAKHSTHC